MELKYTCPGCGTPLGYDGLCWKCKCEQDRNAALAWTPEQIAEKQRNLIQNIQRLAEMEDPELTDFWQLLSYRDAITPEIQRAALDAEVFSPCELYYHAPEDVRDALVAALLKAEYSRNAADLMSCLAMQGDDKAMETLLELETKSPALAQGPLCGPVQLCADRRLDLRQGGPENPTQLRHLLSYGQGNRWREISCSHRPTTGGHLPPLRRADGGHAGAGWPG